MRSFIGRHIKFLRDHGFHAVDSDPWIDVWFDDISIFYRMSEGSPDGSYGVGLYDGRYRWFSPFRDVCSISSFLDILRDPVYEMMRMIANPYVIRTYESRAACNPIYLLKLAGEPHGIGHLNWWPSWVQKYAEPVYTVACLETVDQLLAKLAKRSPQEIVSFIEKLVLAEVRLRNMSCGDVSPRPVSAWNFEDRGVAVVLRKIHDFSRKYVDVDRLRENMGKSWAASLELAR